MAEAALYGSEIEHTGMLAGFLAGALLGAALIVASAVLFPFGAPLLVVVLSIIAIGVSSVVAWELVELGKSLGAMLSSPTGTLTSGSANVFINGRPAALAEISTALCHKDAPSIQVAEGSSSVFINGKPAARIKDKLTCGARISSGSNNVFIGGGTLQLLPIQEEVSAAWYDRVDTLFMVAEFVGALSAVVRAGIRLTSTCLVRFAQGTAVGEVISQYIMSPAVAGVTAAFGGLFGEPVNVITGQKVLLGEAEVDVDLAAPLPLVLQRYYQSDFHYQGMFGIGWHSNWEAQLRLVDDSLLYRDAMGREITLPKVAEAEKIYYAAERLFITGLPHGQFAVHADDALFWVFNPLNEYGIATLNRLENQLGQQIVCHYDGSGRLAKLTDSSAGQLSFEYDAEQPQRLARLWYQPDRHLLAGRQVVRHYQYDTNGQLIEVRDALRRRRRFAYQQQLMHYQEFADGYAVYYEWQAIEQTPRVIYTEDNRGARQRYAYDLAAQCSTVQQLSQEAKVLSEAVWHYDTQQQVTHYRDFDGRSYQLQYNEAGDLVKLTLPAERSVQLSYDALGRIVKQQDPLGGITLNAYQGNFLHLIRQTLPEGSSWRAEYRPNGLLTAVTDPLGRTTQYHYNDAQQLSEIIDPQQGRIQLSFDPKGQLLCYTDCSGQRTQYEYSATGELLKVTDSTAQQTRYQYDASGLLTQLTQPDGSVLNWAYNERGLLCEQRDAMGYLQQWHYTDSGQLSQQSDPLKRSVHYHYTPLGQLRSLYNANGARYLFRYDAVGRLLAQQHPDGISEHYYYNAAGELAELTQQGTRQANRLRPRRREHFRYDAVGQLLEQQQDSTQSEYHYDAMGRLIACQVTPTAAGRLQGIVPNQLKFNYNAAGELIAEQGPQGTLTYHYDPLGYLSQLTLPRGDNISWLRYGAGHVSAIRYNQQLISELTRNARYQETERTQGALTQQRHYDKLGRLTQLQASGTPHQALWRHYTYNPNNNLTSVEESQRGLIQLQYDAAGRLISRHSMSHGMHLAEQRYMDAADNLIEHYQSAAIQDNRVTQLHGIRQQFDAWGNLVFKKSPSEQHHFEYDSANRLVKAHGYSPFGRYQAQYEYDALGRRSAKTIESDSPSLAKGRTEFLWHGLTLIRETHQAQRRTYLYTPDDAYNPLAHVDEIAQQQAIYYYHTDLNAQPLDITDQSGQIVWSGEYTDWGKLRWQNPHYLMAQNKLITELQINLRYAGQYCDEETGLHYNTFRYYDPDTARFTTRDPIGLTGGLNLYSYAPNPVNWIDPWGWSCLPKVIRGPQGEPLSASIRISRQDLGTGTATNSTSRAWAKKMGHNSDDAGHILAKALGGQGGIGNIFPQSPFYNRGEYREFEQLVKRAVKQHGSVDIQWKFSYGNGSTRPTEIEYNVFHQGKRILYQNFKN